MRVNQTGDDKRVRVLAARHIGKIIQKGIGRTAGDNAPSSDDQQTVLNIFASAFSGDGRRSGKVHKRGTMRTLGSRQVHGRPLHTPKAARSSFVMSVRLPGGMEGTRTAR